MLEFAARQRASFPSDPRCPIRPGIRRVRVCIDVNLAGVIESILSSLKHVPHHP